jgi:hypothetical protein
MRVFERFDKSTLVCRAFDRNYFHTWWYHKPYVYSHSVVRFDPFITGMRVSRCYGFGCTQSFPF